jgi:hypothetical protein
VSLNGSNLIATTRQLLERADPMTAGIWPRASALLARQALEAALDDLWRRRARGLEMCSARAQLLCLPFYLPDDEELAERVSYTWAGLSRATHQHPYELSPTSSELLAWIATVEQLISRVQSICSRRS